MKAIDRLYQVVGDITDNDVLKGRLTDIAELLEKEVEREAENRKMLANEMVSAYMAYIDNDSRRKSDAFRATWTRHLLKDKHWSGSYEDARKFINSLDLFVNNE